MVRSSQSRNAKFDCEELRYEIRFKEIEQPTFDQTNNQIIELFIALEEFIKSKARATDRVGLVFDHPDLQWTLDHPFVRVDQFDIKNVLQMFHKVHQSRRELRIDETLTLSIFIAHLPNGGMAGFDSQFAIRHRCVKFVDNRDNMCAIRAVLIAKAYCDDDPQKEELCKINSSLLDKKTHDLANKLGLMNKTCTLDEIARIERYLRHYRISVFTRTDCIYRGVPNSKYIYLLYDNNHYNAITSISAFLNFHYYCHPCLKGYNVLGDHQCDSTCVACKRSNCIKVDPVTCPHCKKETYSEKCKQLHLENFCPVLKECPKCGSLARQPNKRKNQHVCDHQRFCINCKIAVDPDNHRCFVLNEEEKRAKKAKRSKNCHEQKTSSNCEGYIFFDYEAMQDTSRLDRAHKANLICALRLCLNCVNKSAQTNQIQACGSDTCGRFEFTSNELFCEWLFQLPHYVALAHNMKGYDGVFIMNYIYNHILPTDPEPAVIANGSKLLMIRFRQVKIVDSFSFIPIPLADFTSAFETNELKKGHFPHLFNTPENKNYVGPYPAAEFYGTKYFSSKKLIEFNQWHSEQQGKVFDFAKEIREYCWSDVLLLAMGCIKYRQIILDLSKKHGSIDPFVQCNTIASLCHIIYRTMHLKPNTLPFIPENGYNVQKNHSYKSIAWLEWLMARDGTKIRHANNLGEYKFGSYYVDGYDETNDTIYEFHGCYFHGCQKCYSPETFNQVLQATMKSIYNRHCNRMTYLKKSAKHVVEIWECEFDKLNMLKEINVKIRKPLSPRDALFGGRTNALRLHYKVQDDEKIKYVDFTSLYPYVQKYCRYPVGHPQIILDNFNLDISNYFGIIKCKVLPPRGLYIPVLPSKINNKLVFALCCACAHSRASKCQHSDEERSIEGTWVSLELQKAVSLGYKVVEISEVWHWEESEVYDPETKTGGIFTDYINLFLKGKQEASGFPSDVTDKFKYADEFREREGVCLDLDAVHKNPGKRFVYKLFLNSMWGRLGMNTDRTTYKLITDPSQWFDLVRDDSYIIKAVDFSHTNPNSIQVFYTNRLNEGSTETSVPHAAFVTAHARLKLYSELEKIGDRVLYFDTDSIIYVSKPGTYEPKTGNFLGELTNELDNPNDYIEEFVSAGPKNYAYRTHMGKANCTVKGFRLSSCTASSINFESIRNLVLNERDETIEAEQLVFRREKHEWHVRTEEQKKLYRFVYDKRVLFDDLTTLPYGF